MYVRLAFAVAAHLEPEILIIDEVLAVGDASFQKKSLGKMQSVAVNENRTVLFVSHSLQAVQSLCDRAILLNSGTSVMQGESRSVVARYLADVNTLDGERMWPGEGAPGNDDLTASCGANYSQTEGMRDRLTSDEDFCVELEFIMREAGS